MEKKKKTTITIFQVEHFSLPRPIESLAVFALTPARCNRFQVAEMSRVLLFSLCALKSAHQRVFLPPHPPPPSLQVFLFLLETLAKETLSIHCFLLGSNSASSARDARRSHFPGDGERNHHSNDQRQKKPGSPSPLLPRRVLPRWVPAGVQKTCLTLWPQGKQLTLGDKIFRS